MVSPAVQSLFASVTLLTYVLIAWERVHKTVAALAGALVLTALALHFGVVDGYERIHELLAHDLGVLGVIVGTSILVDLAGTSGLFHFLAIKVVKRTAGRPARLFLALQLLVFALAALLTIVPAMLIVSGLALVICRSLNLKPVPFLLGIAFASNAGAFVTFASGLPTLMIGTAAGIPYVQFLQVSLPFALIAFAVGYVWTRRAFREALGPPAGPAEELRLKETVEAFDEWALAPDRRAFVRAGAVLALTILGFAFAGVLGVGLDFVAMAGGTALLFFGGRPVEEAVRRVNWSVILFFTGLFLVVGLLAETGLLARLARALGAVTGGSIPFSVALFTGASGVASAVVDNIPVAATMIPIVQGMEGVPKEPLWWSLVFGCNLGGSATPIGSISCVIALHTLAHEAGIQIGFGRFLALGGGLVAVQLVLAAAYLSLLHALGLIPPIPPV